MYLLGFMQALKFWKTKQKYFIFAQAKHLKAFTLGNSTCVVALPVHLSQITPPVSDEVCRDMTLPVTLSEHKLQEYWQLSRNKRT